MKILIYRLDSSHDDVQLNAIFPLFIEKMQMEKEIVCKSYVISSDQVFAQKTMFKTKPTDCHILFLTGLEQIGLIENVKELEYAPLIFWLGDKAPILTSSLKSVLPDMCVLPRWEITQELEESLLSKCKLLPIDNFCHQATPSLFSQQMLRQPENQAFCDDMSDRVVIAIEVDADIDKLQSFNYQNLAEQIFARILKKGVALESCTFVLSAPIASLDFLNNHLLMYVNSWEARLNPAELLVLGIVNQLEDHGVEWQNHLLSVNNQTCAQLNSLIDVANLGKQSIFFMPNWQGATAIECVGRLEGDSELICYGNSCSNFTLSLLNAGYMTEIDAIDIQQSRASLRAPLNSDELNPAGVIASSLIEFSLAQQALGSSKLKALLGYSFLNAKSGASFNKDAAYPPVCLVNNNRAETHLAIVADYKAAEVLVSKSAVSPAKSSPSWSGFFSLMATTAVLSALAACALPAIKNGSLKNFRLFR